VDAKPIIVTTKVNIAVNKLNSAVLRNFII